MSASIRRALTASALALAVGVSLFGCDASESEPNPAAGTSLTVTPSLGLVRNAAIVVRNAAGTQVGTGMTDNNGVASLRAQGSGPFVVEVQGGGSAQYFDENTGAFVSFPAGQSIHALVPAGTTNVGVTGLTEVAHALWNANGVPLTNANANAANEAIRAAMASALPSLITPPNPLGAAPTPNSLTASAADLYASILAGLADAGAGSTGLPPALAVIDQLRRDVQDGDIDGNDGTSAFTTLYNAAGFATQFQNFIDTRRTSWGNAAQQATTFNLVALVEPSWNSGGGGGTGGGGSTIPATLKPALAGVYDLVFHMAPGVSASVPFTEGTHYPVTVSSSGLLVVNGISYTSPFHRVINNFTIDSEVNWDSGLGFDFALSDNSSGQFNEINLYSFSSGGGGAQKFIGQLRQPDAGPDLTALTALAGDHALVVTDKSGTLTRVPSAFLAGQDVTLSVGAGGAVSSARLTDTFDPAATATTYRSYLTGSIEPRVEITRTDDRGTSDTGDDITYTMSLYLENGVLLGARYTESAPCGFTSGCWTEASVTLEVRPVPTAHQSFITALAAANVQNVTVIQRANNAFLPALCTEVPVVVTTGTQPQQPPVTFTINNYQQAWSPRYSRLSDAPVTGNPMMRFLLMSVENMGSGLIRVREHSGSSIAAIATNDPAQISAAGCSTGGSGQLDATYSGTMSAMGGAVQQPIGPDTETVTGNLAGITETVIRDSILRDYPDASGLTVALDGSSNSTRKQFNILFTRNQAPLGEMSYSLTYTYEVP